MILKQEDKKKENINQVIKEIQQKLKYVNQVINNSNNFQSLQLNQEFQKIEQILQRYPQLQNQLSIKMIKKKINQSQLNYYKKFKQQQDIYLYCKQKILQYQNDYSKQNLFYTSIQKILCILAAISFKNKQFKTCQSYIYKALFYIQFKLNCQQRQEQKAMLKELTIKVYFLLAKNCNQMKQYKTGIKYLEIAIQQLQKKGNTQQYQLYKQYKDVLIRKQNFFFNLLDQKNLIYESFVQRMLLNRSHNKESFSKISKKTFFNINDIRNKSQYKDIQQDKQRITSKNNKNRSLDFRSKTLKLFNKTQHLKTYKKINQSYNQSQHMSKIILKGKSKITNFSKFIKNNKQSNKNIFVKQEQKITYKLKKSIINKKLINKQIKQIYPYFQQTWHPFSKKQQSFQQTKILFNTAQLCKQDKLETKRDQLQELIKNKILKRPKNKKLIKNVQTTQKDQKDKKYKKDQKDQIIQIFQKERKDTISEKKMTQQKMDSSQQKLSNNRIRNILNKKRKYFPTNKKQQLQENQSLIQKNQQQISLILQESQKSNFIYDDIDQISIINITGTKEDKLQIQSEKNQQIIQQKGWEGGKIYINPNGLTLTLFNLTFKNQIFSNIILVYSQLHCIYGVRYKCVLANFSIETTAQIKQILQGNTTKYQKYHELIKIYIKKMRIIIDQDHLVQRLAAVVKHKMINGWGYNQQQRIFYKYSKILKKKLKSILYLKFFHLKNDIFIAFQAVTQKQQTIIFFYNYFTKEGLSGKKVMNDYTNNFLYFQNFIQQITQPPIIKKASMLLFPYSQPYYLSPTASQNILSPINSISSAAQSQKRFFYSTPYQNIYIYIKSTIISIIRKQHLGGFNIIKLDKIQQNKLNIINKKFIWRLGIPKQRKIQQNISQSESNGFMFDILCNRFNKIQKYFNRQNHLALIQINNLRKCSINIESFYMRKIITQKTIGFIKLSIRPLNSVTKLIKFVISQADIQLNQSIIFTNLLKKHWVAKFVKWISKNLVYVNQGIGIIDKTINTIITYKQNPKLFPKNQSTLIKTPFAFKIEYQEIIKSKFAKYLIIRICRSFLQSKLIIYIYDPFTKRKYMSNIELFSLKKLGLDNVENYWQQLSRFVKLISLQKYNQHVYLKLNNENAILQQYHLNQFYFINQQIKSLKINIIDIRKYNNPFFNHYLPFDTRDAYNFQVFIQQRNYMTGQLTKKKINLMYFIESYISKYKPVDNIIQLSDIKTISSQLYFNFQPIKQHVKFQIIKQSYPINKDKEYRNQFSKQINKKLLFRNILSCRNKIIITIFYHDHCIAIVLQDIKKGKKTIFKFDETQMQQIKIFAKQYKNGNIFNHYGKILYEKIKSILQKIQII